MKFIFHIILLAIIPTLLISCGSANQRAKDPETDPKAVLEQPETHGIEVKEMKIDTPIDQAMVKSGLAIYDLKCSACHKLTDEKLVGPGWKGVTNRRTPVWITNMITNVDMMLADDIEAQKLLEQCLVRMPNQNITATDARHIIEFMRSNDVVK